MMGVHNMNSEVIYGESFQSTFENEGNFILTNLDNMETYPAPCDTQDPFMSNTPIENNVTNWEGKDCLRWAQQVCFQQNINQYTVNLDFFSTVNGNDLLQYSQHDFCNATGYQNGGIFYQEFQRILFSQGIMQSSPYYDHEYATSPCSDYSGCDQYDDLMQFMQMNEDVSDLDQFVHEDSAWLPVDMITEVDNSHHMPPSPVIKIEEPLNLDESSSDTTSTWEPEPRSCSALEKIKTDSRKRVRGPKNWEFVIRLLLDNSFNPEVIRWEDKADYTFRLVNPAAIAKIWGERANKPNLTYDNFARGLRYHYTTGALHPVSDRQLVYRCGPKAIDFLNKLSRKSS